MKVLFVLGESCLTKRPVQSRRELENQLRPRSGRVVTQSMSPSMCVLTSEDFTCNVFFLKT